MKTLAQQISEKEKEQLSLLIAWVGGQSNLSRLLGVTPQVVNNWVSRGRISATAASVVEKKLNGKFKKSDLRPDVLNWRF